MLEPEKEWACDAIIDKICSLDIFRKSRRIFIFMSNDSEPNTEILTGLMLSLEKEVSVPKVVGDDMLAKLITPFTNFFENKWGILEPCDTQTVVDIDLAIIPMVAFGGLDRVGHGKGYYDKFLADKNCYKLGIAFDCQDIKSVQCDSYDIQLDMILTEKRVITKDNIENNEFGVF